MQKSSTRPSSKQMTGSQDKRRPVESPNRVTPLVRHAKSDGAQHVSPSPFYTEKQLPDFVGTTREKLNACLAALHSAEYSGRPTISDDCSSAFAAKIRVVSDFLRAVVDTDGQYGGHNGESAALYVCGAPGLGKTSGVKWCCETAALKYEKQDGPTIKICNLAASAFTTQTDPLQSMLNEIGNSLQVKKANPTIETVKKGLTRYKSKPNKSLLILVIDEIDALVSSTGLTSMRGKALQTLLEWANNPEMQMAIIGISNCMNDETFEYVLKDGLVSSSRCTLSILIVERAQTQRWHFSIVQGSGDVCIL
jgi:Cdc6-like AAA superfamily ATPase